MPTNAELADSLKNANAKIAELEGKLSAAHAESPTEDSTKLDIANAKIAELEGQLRTADTNHARQLGALQRELEEAQRSGRAELPYELRVAIPSGMLLRYDSVFHGRPGDPWLFHERHALGEDSGYSTAIKDRIVASIDRAFGTVRLGQNGRGGQDFSLLPAFSRDHAFDVIVRLIPKES